MKNQFAIEIHKQSNSTLKIKFWDFWWLLQLQNLELRFFMQSIETNLIPVEDYIERATTKRPNGP